MDPQALRPFVSCPSVWVNLEVNFGRKSRVEKPWGQNRSLESSKHVCNSIRSIREKVAGSRGVVLDLECGLFRGHRVLRVGVGGHLSGSNVQDFLW